jgi:uncharacterized repeat protein (TIGR03803 family)
MDQSGNLYGTTRSGGKHQGGGVVFKLVPNAVTGKYREYILHNFCASANCADGQTPTAELIMDVHGNLYGTTEFGGKYAHGAVFKLTHGASGWSLGVINSFCPVSNCADGRAPETGLDYAGQASGAPWDEFSPLFGTTEYGGTNDKGVAYKLSVDGSLWNYEVIHNFNSPAASETAEAGPILVDSSLNLFGVTGSGGKFGAGVLYRLAAGTWKETTLHNFCAEPNCTDGATGVGRLAMDAAGNLFGTTWYSDCGNSSCDYGIAFERTAPGAYSVINHFCNGSGCPDGYFPFGLIIDAGGNLYGTTERGGQGDNGTIFRLSYDSNAEQWTENVLYSFCSNDGDCKKGKTPQAPPILDQQGNLYGTTSDGGAGFGGTVFELTP